VLNDAVSVENKEKLNTTMYTTSIAAKGRCVSMLVYYLTRIKRWNKVMRAAVESYAGESDFLLP